MDAITRVSLKIKWLRIKRWILRLLCGLALVATLTGCADARWTAWGNLCLSSIAILSGLGVVCLLIMLAIYLLEPRHA